MHKNFAAEIVESDNDSEIPAAANVGGRPKNRLYQAASGEAFQMHLQCWGFHPFALQASEKFLAMPLPHS